MELKQALKEQYHAGLAMLAECVEKCPDNLWTTGETPRTFWRIAFHAAFYTHLYLGQNEEAFQPWPGRREGIHTGLYAASWDGTPIDWSAEPAAYSRAEILDYLHYINRLIDPTVDQLDLGAPETGFPWYRNMTKLSHQLMNLRHTQSHIGQLSELLMAHRIDTGWIGKSAAHTA